MNMKSNPTLDKQCARKTRWTYYLSTFFLRCLFWSTGGLKCVGTENIPETGPVILAGNHTSVADPPALSCKLRRQIHFLSKIELFRPPFGFWLLWAGQFPIRRGVADRRAIKQSIDILGAGDIVGMFPEGTRSEDGNLGEPGVGIGLIALKSRAPVVPAAIFGTAKVLPPHAKRLYRHPVTVVYGKPITFPDLYDSKDSRAAMEEVGRRTMAAIAELLSSHAS